MYQGISRQISRGAIATASVLALVGSVLTVTATNSSAADPVLPPIDVIQSEIGSSPNSDSDGQLANKKNYGWLNANGNNADGRTEIVYNDVAAANNFASLLELQTTAKNQHERFYHYFSSNKFPSIDTDVNPGRSGDNMTGRPVQDFIGKEMSTTLKSTAGVVTFQFELMIKPEGQWIGTLYQNRTDNDSITDFTKIEADLGGEWVINKGNVAGTTGGGALNLALGREKWDSTNCGATWCTFTLAELAQADLAEVNPLGTHVFGLGINRGSGEDPNLHQVKDITILGQKFRFLTQRIDMTPVSNVDLTAGTVSEYATATSGLPVSVTSQTPGVCVPAAGAGGTLTLKSAGTCTVKVSQAGNGTTFGPAPVQTVSFRVVGGAPTPPQVVAPHKKPTVTKITGGPRAAKRVIRWKVPKMPNNRPVQWFQIKVSVDRCAKPVLHRKLNKKKTSYTIKRGFLLKNMTCKRSRGEVKVKRAKFKVQVTAHNSAGSGPVSSKRFLVRR